MLERVPREVLQSICGVSANYLGHSWAIVWGILAGIAQGFKKMLGNSWGRTWAMAWGDPWGNRAKTLGDLGHVFEAPFHDCLGKSRKALG